MVLRAVHRFSTQYALPVSTNQVNNNHYVLYKPIVHNFYPPVENVFFGVMYFLRMLGHYETSRAAGPRRSGEQKWRSKIKDTKRGANIWGSASLPDKYFNCLIHFYRWERKGFRNSTSSSKKYIMTRIFSSIVAICFLVCLFTSLEPFKGTLTHYRLFSILQVESFKQ